MNKDLKCLKSNLKKDKNITKSNKKQFGHVRSLSYKNYIKTIDV